MIPGLDYAKLAVLALQVVLWLMDQAKARQQFNAGRDNEIAKTSLEVLRRTDAGKALEAAISALPKDDRERLLTELEG